MLGAFIVISMAFTYSANNDQKQIMTITQRFKMLIITTPTERKEIKIDEKNELSTITLSTLSDYQKQGWVVKNTNMMSDSGFWVYYFYLEK